MQTLNVELGERSYPILIGSGLLGDAGAYGELAENRQVLIVTNTTIAPLYLSTVEQALSATKLRSLALADGESHKTLDTAADIFDALMAESFARDCVIVALGGGVIGDMAGFAAAAYQRGVDFIQIPTTLLAQVDSSVGGKTAVNHPRGKNMIGAFHQPRRVLIDTDVLATLPDRELSAGLAEVIKYGLIRDLPFLAWLEDNLERLLQRDRDALTHAIAESCRNKAEVVAADERESGQRALLNLGHTFGHAIEAGLGYGEWLHGEAVAAGMCVAARMSQALGLVSQADVQRVERLFAAAGLPIHPPVGLGPDRALELMGHDKKVLGGRIRLVLLRQVGEAFVTGDYDSAVLERILADNFSLQA